MLLLIEVNCLLYCKNPLCGEKTLKRIEHFAKTLKIKGLGPISLRKLGITSLQELYDLTLEEVVHSLGSKLLAVRLLEQLERSQKAPLNVLLAAFSIPLVGKTAAEKLSKVSKHIDDIDYKVCRSAGLGEKTALSLCNWIENEYYDVSFLPFSFKFIETVTTSAVMGVVCISGKLTSYKSKAEAQQILVSLGYEVKTSLTKDVTILVNESGIESAKTKKARDAGVQIVNNLKTLIGE